MTATALPIPGTFGPDVLRHLDAQLESARRLLQAVLHQSQAIRARNVDGVLAHLGTIQAEMERRSLLERDRTLVLTRAGQALGVPAHAVTLEAMTALMDPATAEAARTRSTELRGLLAEVGQQHHLNRALMRQELAFLGHLVGMLGGAGEDGGYRPPAEPGGSMRVTLGGVGATGYQTARRVLDLEV
ncbi:flagellar export chaperone FlgN [Conexibacter sp. SYSU D00693]|uniref:flagellar export chaperone FlgN n=1 Tax=Conexibacter sp. SYSU D00693 TaxID=2812560 RepID=UPI00196A533E|nr:flagellar export chaperone FlgN [Conexibacter sp. SYSU D00693]